MSLFLAATATPYHRLANNRPVAHPISGQNLNESSIASFLINVGHERVEGGSYSTIGPPTGPVQLPPPAISPSGFELMVTSQAVTGDLPWSQTCRVTVPGGGFSDFVVSGNVIDTSVVVPDATLVSTYPLDLGSPDDGAPVSPVNGLIVGTQPWTSTATGSLVSGVPPTTTDKSFYKIGGDAAVKLPANNAAHNLTSMSLSWYVQFTNAPTAQEAMFSGATNASTQPGDFSCERGATGLLRVWHVGPDGLLRYAGGAPPIGNVGITGVTLVAGIAYRIELIFGLAGLRIYLNNTLVTTITQNTNGWNNSREKWLGTFSDGSIPASAVFDHLQVWSGELSDAQRAALPAPQPVPLPTGPISIWKLDETSGVVFDDSEPANVNATIAGTWADLNTATMVRNVGGTSAHTTGSGWATFPASQAAHALTDLTISFYYQRRTEAAKHVLLAAGDGTAAGDFSIEVLANGRLRGYHVGQDAVLRFFDDNLGLGIASTDLGLAAHRITVSFGGLGAKIYLDGTPLTVGTIEENLNGWNNSRVKYLGAFPTTLATPADGAFDHVRLWDRQLSDAEVAGLEPATSITLTPPVTTGLIVPDVGQFLTNDDFAIPSQGTIRWASPGASGNGTSEGSAGDLHAMLAACAAGDTVVATQGYYSCPSGVTLKAGISATQPTTLMAKPGSWIVLCRDTSFLKMGQMPAGAGRGTPTNWTLHDAATNTWKVAYSGSASYLDGCWHDGGMMHMLFPYQTYTDPTSGASTTSLAALMSTQTTATAPIDKTKWWFSGTAVSGGFAYIRMAHPNWADMGLDPVYGGWRIDDEANFANTRYAQGFESPPSHAWFTAATPGNKNSGRPTIGQGLDPNSLKIYLGASASGVLLNDASGNFTRFGSGVNSMGFNKYIQNQGNHELHRGSHYLPGYFIFPTSGTVSNITAHRARLYGYGEHKMQGSMNVMKYNDTGEVLENSHRNSLVNVGVAGTANITFDNCTLCYWHEVIVGSPNPMDRTRFVNCVFHCHFDEWGQVCNVRMTNLEVGYSYFRDGSIYCGGSGANIGAIQTPFCTEYWHHNIQDGRLPRGANDRSNDMGGQISPSIPIRTPLGGVNSNGRSLGGPNVTPTPQGACKKYNNTTISPCDPAARRTNSMCWDIANSPVITFPGNNPRLFDEAFNNILMTHDTKRYRGRESTSANWIRVDHVEWKPAIRSGTTLNKHYRDYNTYWRDVPNDPLTNARSQEKFYLLNYTGGTHAHPSFDYIRNNNGTEPTGSSIFYNSSEWQFTKNSAQAAGFPDGWESHGSDDNPQIPSVDTFPAQRMDYRPRNGQIGVATAPSVTAGGSAWYSSDGWTSYGAVAVPWKWAPSNWRGALDPANTTTMPVGVQNP